MASAIAGEAGLTEQDYEGAGSVLPQLNRALPDWYWLVFGSIQGTALATIFGERALLFWVALVAVVVVALGPRWLRRYRRKVWARRAAADAGGTPQTFRFDEQGVLFSSSERRHELGWGELKQYIESPATFLIFTGSQGLLLVPKRAFKGNDVEALREMLRERLPARPMPQRYWRRSSFGRVTLVWVGVMVASLSVWHLLSNSPPPEHEPKDVDSSP